MPSPQLDKVLAFIKREIGAGKQFPSARQIRDHMGWLNDRASCDALMSLAAKGHLRVKNRTPSGRGWRYEWALLHCIAEGESPVGK